MNKTINAIFNSYILTKSKNADSIAQALSEKTGETLTPEMVAGMKLEQFMQTKANEAMSTGQAGSGGNTVNGEVLANIIVDRVRDQESLLSFLPNQRNMVNPIEPILVEGPDVEFASFAENADVPGNDVPSAKVGLDKVVLDASDTAHGVTFYYTRDLLEDSVVNIAAYIDNKIERAFIRTVHQALINGDTADTINGTTTATSVLRKFDGLRKYAIDGSRVTTGVLTAAKIREARATLGAKGVYPEDLIMTMDYQTYSQILSLGQVETMEKFGMNATISEGVLQSIDGTRIIPRAEVASAADTGIIDTGTPANNDHGQIAIFHAPSVYVGWRRMLSVEGDYSTTKQQYSTTATTRFALELNENDAPAAALITVDR